MALWFETAVSYDKMMENGAVKRVVGKYLFDSLTFTEAESRTIEEMTPFISGEFSVKAAKKTKIQEIFFDSESDKYFYVKVNFISIDEKTRAEKKNTSLMLVQAPDLETALIRFKESMKDTMADFEIASIAESPIVDVFPIRPADLEKS